MREVHQRYIFFSILFFIRSFFQKGERQRIGIKGGGLLYGTRTAVAFGFAVAGYSPLLCIDFRFHKN